MVKGATKGTGSQVITSSSWKIKMSTQNWKAFLEILEKWFLSPQGAWLNTRQHHSSSLKYLSGATKMFASPRLPGGRGRADAGAAGAAGPQELAAPPSPLQVIQSGVPGKAAIPSSRAPLLPQVCTGTCAHMRMCERACTQHSPRPDLLQT